MPSYDVWVKCDFDGKWERHTLLPFPTIKRAESWAKRYIPKAEWKVVRINEPRG